MNSDKLKFISNNVKAIQKSEKTIKIFDYLKNGVSPNEFIFLQETYSSVDDKKKGDARSFMAFHIFFTVKVIRAVQQ